jgi:hypothetical protein
MPKRSRRESSFFPADNFRQNSLPGDAIQLAMCERRRSSSSHVRENVLVRCPIHDPALISGNRSMHLQKFISRSARRSGENSPVLQHWVPAKQSVESGLKNTVAVFRHRWLPFALRQTALHPPAPPAENTNGV